MLLTRTFVACVLVTLFAVPRSLMAQHVIGTADLQAELVRSSQTRQRNLKTVQQFLSSPRTESALASAHMNAGQVQAAVSTLSDKELARLASRVNKVSSRFRSGQVDR